MIDVKCAALSVVALMVLSGTSGCVGLSANQAIEGEYRYTQIGNAEMWRASTSALIIERCIPKEGQTITTTTKGFFGAKQSHTCYGEYVDLNVAVHPQTGIAASVVAPMVQAAGIAYAGHEIGRGIRKGASKTNVNQAGGGASSQADSQASGGAGGAGGTSSARQSQASQLSQVQSQAQTQLQTHTAPMMMHGRD